MRRRAHDFPEGSVAARGLKSLQKYRKKKIPTISLPRSGALWKILVLAGGVSHLFLLGYRSRLDGGDETRTLARVRAMRGAPPPKRAPHPLQLRLAYDSATGGQTAVRTAPAEAASPFREEEGGGPVFFLPPNDGEPNARALLEDDECKVIHDWQLLSFPSCNDFHEISPADLWFIARGGSRIVFKLEDFDGTPFALKALKLRDTYVPKHYEQQRKDILLMEANTKSPYIADGYGHCALSIFTQYSTGGTIQDLIKESRLNGGSQLKTVDKLRIGYQIAKGVADLHGNVTGGAPPIFTHDDICCHQYIYLDGVFKLNDFNYAGIGRISKESGEQCLDSCHMAIWRGRGLEEFQAEITGKKFKHDKVDIWMMGNVIYYVLTDKYLFESVGTRKAAIKKQLLGELSPFPSKIARSDDPAEVALKKAIHMCWTFDTEKRPSANAIAGYLLERLKDIAGEASPVVTVEIPPLPSNHRFTDSDMDQFK